MAKRRHTTPRADRFTVLSAREATQLKKPRFNGYAIGYGPHGDTRYNRAAEKRRFRDETDNDR